MKRLFLSLSFLIFSYPALAVDPAKTHHPYQESELSVYTPNFVEHSQPAIIVPYKPPSTRTVTVITTKADSSWLNIQPVKVKIGDKTLILSPMEAERLKNLLNRALQPQYQHRMNNPPSPNFPV